MTSSRRGGGGDGADDDDEGTRFPAGAGAWLRGAGGDGTRAGCPRPRGSDDVDDCDVSDVTDALLG